jgi:hypothetical protein
MITTSATEQALNITLNDVKAAAERIKVGGHPVIDLLKDLVVILSCSTNEIIIN